MFRSLTYRNKNYLLLVATTILLIASWQLAFKKTVDAITLNHKLSTQSEDKANLTFNPEYLNQKSQTLDRVLKKYTLDSVEWADDFWLNTSRIAATKDIRIDFHPDGLKNLSPDSASVISRQTISFEGDYKNLVVLLDSVQKTDKVGFITSSVFKKDDKRMQTEPAKLTLQLIFSIVQKN